MKNMKKRNMFIILGICIFTIALVGGTYAFLENVIFNDLTVNTTTKGLDYYINYTKGTNISNGSLTPSSDYTGGQSATITLYKKDSTYNIYGQIYLDITSVGSGISGSDIVKYAVVSSASPSVPIATGNLYGTTNNSSKLLAGNIALSTASTTYTIYLWIDEDDIDSYDVESQSISASIRCEATNDPSGY